MASNAEIAQELNSLLKVPEPEPEIMLNSRFFQTVPKSTRQIVNEIA